jgi:hypothetical protein
MKKRGRALAIINNKGNDVVFHENQEPEFKLAIDPIPCDCAHPKCHGYFVPTRLGQEKCVFWLVENGVIDHYPLLGKMSKNTNFKKDIKRFNLGILRNRVGQARILYKSYRNKSVVSKTHVYEYCYKTEGQKSDVYLWCSHSEMMEWYLKN